MSKNIAKYMKTTIDKTNHKLENDRDIFLEIRIEKC